MSYSYEKTNKYILNNSQTKKKQRDFANSFTCKRYSSNNNRMKLISNQETPLSRKTNISVIKENEKQLDYQYFSFPIKPLEEDSINNFFIKKNKKICEIPKDINIKKITFQRQKDKQIMEFNLYNDKDIFKDINKAYLQDQKSDDGDDSPDEKILLGKTTPFQALDESAKELKECLKFNNGKDLLSRKIRFKTNNK